MEISDICPFACYVFFFFFLKFEGQCQYKRQKKKPCHQKNKIKENKEEKKKGGKKEKKRIIKITLPFSKGSLEWVGGEVGSWVE